MRGLFFSLLLVFSSTVVSAEVYKLLPNKSKVGWEGRKVAGGHNGTVMIKSGQMDFNKKANTMKGNVVLDLNTIKNLDMKGEWAQKLENHLKSPDFFNVKAHPTAKFELTAVEATKGANNYMLKGNLTVKGITKPLSFPGNVSFSGDKATLKAKFKIDRSKWDIRYNSKSFFDAKKLGDKMINDEIEFDLDVVASKGKGVM